MARGIDRELVVGALAEDPENTLSFADAPTEELQARIAAAIAHAAAWAKESHGDGALKVRIVHMRDVDLPGIMAKVKKDAPFVGKATKTAYEKLSKDWAQLSRDVMADTNVLPQPALTDAFAALVMSAGTLAKNAGAGLLAGLKIEAIAIPVLAAGVLYLYLKKGK